MCRAPDRSTGRLAAEKAKHVCETATAHPVHFSVDIDMQRSLVTHGLLISGLDCLPGIRAPADALVLNVIRYIETVLPTSLKTPLADG